MTHRYIKIGVTVVVLVLAFTGLLWSTLRDGTEYYKNVDEVVADQQAWEGKPLQLHGYVVPGSDAWTRSAGTHARVPLQGPEHPPRANETTDVQMVDASYTGIVPDTFKGEAEVVLKGQADVRPDSRPTRTASWRSARRSTEAAQLRLIDGLPRHVSPARQLSSSAATPAVVSVVGARRRSRRLIESGIGAFYLVAALMTAASAVMINAFLTDDYSIKYVVHYSDSVQPLFYKITSYWGGLDGSIMFWVFLLSVFGIGGRVREPRAPPRADSVRRRDHLIGADVLPVPDGRAQEPVHDVPDERAGRRRGAEPAAAELLDGDPSAVALHGLRRHDHPVRVRHRRAHHRATSTTRGCARSAAGRWSAGCSCRSA